MPIQTSPSPITTPVALCRLLHLVTMAAIQVLVSPHLLSHFSGLGLLVYLLIINAFHLHLAATAPFRIYSISTGICDLAVLELLFMATYTAIFLWGSDALLNWMAQNAYRQVNSTLFLLICVRLFWPSHWGWPQLGFFSRYATDRLPMSPFITIIWLVCATACVTCGYFILYAPRGWSNAVLGSIIMVAAAIHWRKMAQSVLSLADDAATAKHDTEMMRARLLAERTKARQD